jgi:dihydropteroate synthase
VAQLRPFEFRRLTLDWARTYIMGVVNATPDSFSDSHSSDGVAHARELVRAGADILDVGGESTRPGAPPVSADEEWRRIEPVLQAVQGGAIVSVDTYKAEVAERAIAAGAEIVNDVSGGTLDPELLGVCARRHAAVVLGHIRGTPETMSARAEYQDVVAEVCDELAERVRRAREAGIARIFVDPGLGFAKTGAHNLVLLKRLDVLRGLGCPIVVGASRKSFLGKLTGRDTRERELATAAADTAAILHGADVVRVHDVAAQKDAVVVADAIRRAS